MYIVRLWHALAHPGFYNIAPSKVCVCVRKDEVEPRANHSIQNLLVTSLSHHSRGTKEPIGPV